MRGERGGEKHIFFLPFPHSLSPCACAFLEKYSLVHKTVPPSFQVCVQPYRVWGGTVPQSSVPPETLLCSAREVGVACRERGVIGHLSIDYVTFIHPKTVRTLA